MSDAVARPGLFNLRKRYTRIECDEPDYEGLWAEVRTNLRHDERAEFLENLAAISVDGKDHFTRMLNAFTDAQKQQTEAELAFINAHTEAELAAAQAARATANDAVWTAQQELITANSPEIIENRKQHWLLIAPYVRAWNVGAGDEGEEHDIPPPCVSGLDALPHLDMVVTSWLTSAVERGYRGGKGVRSSSGQSEPTPVQTSGPQLVPETASHS